MIERYCLPQMKKIWLDDNKFTKWLDVEIAVCEAWAELGRIPRKAVPKIKMARFDLKRMNVILKETHHDMTAFLGSISESLGEESRFIHLGLTSSDVIDTALSLQLVEAAKLLNQDIKELISVLAEKALKHKYTVMIGRTHGIHAEPTSFGLKLALWIVEMQRNRQRLAEASKMIAVGKISGAVGTYATISITVLQRARPAQFVTPLAIIAGSLEKFATEIRALQKTDTREVEEPFEPGQTGSSAMPHKRNPELCERICGLSRLMRGYALTSMENIALWHERDISHSSTERIILPDACILLDYCLSLFTQVIAGLLVYPKRMEKNLGLTKGLVFSQRVMLSLIDKGLSRQQAYKLVQHNAMKAWQGNKNYLKLLKADTEITAVLSPSELESLFDYNFYLRYIDDVFKRLGLTELQWNKKPAIHEPAKLGPRSI